MYGAYRTLTYGLWCVAALSRAFGGPAWAERLGRISGVGPGAIWIHAASVGEITGAWPLVRALSDEANVVLTVMTPTGVARARELAGGRTTVAYAPLDLVPAVRTGLARVRPRALLIVETEIWPNLMVEAARAGAKVAIVNGRLTEGSLRRYRMVCPLLRAVRDAVSLVLCQSASDRDRFLSLGLPPARVAVVGSTKYDVLAAPAPEEKRLSVRGALGLPEGASVVVFGSVRPAEEGAVAEAAAEILDARPDAWVVVAPRHLSRVEPLSRRFAALGASVYRRSEPAGDSPGRVILLDTTGELPEVYSVADVAFVGGSLAPYGGHNPLEPAAQGVPVLLGPHTGNCRDAAESLLEAGAAFVVLDAADLGRATLRLLEDDAARREAGARALSAVQAGRGATQRTLELLKAEGIVVAEPGDGRKA